MHGIIGLFFKDSSVYIYYRYPPRYNLYAWNVTNRRYEWIDGTVRQLGIMCMLQCDTDVSNCHSLYLFPDLFVLLVIDLGRLE